LITPVRCTQTMSARISANAQKLVDRADELGRAGQPRAALELFREALRYDRNNPKLLANTAELCLQLGMVEDARKLLVRAYDGAKVPEVTCMLAYCLRQGYRFRDAHRVLDRALRAEPGHPKLLGAKAQLLYMEGRKAEGMEAIEPVLGRAPESWDVANALSMLAYDAGRGEEAVGLIRGAIENESLGWYDRLGLRFGLGELLDKLDRRDEAWEVIDRANADMPSTFDPARFERAVDTLITEWDAERVAGFLTPSRTTDSPVFIVGMPRSGSSLVESILGAHPRVFDGGELGAVLSMLPSLETGGEAVGSVRFDQKTVDVGAQLLVRTYRSVGKGAERVTDKSLGNIMHLGLIAMLTPGAHVIRTRRDPLDTCVSCYFQQFMGSIDFAYNLGHLGVYHRQIDRLFEHWKSVLPLPFYEVEYERLVEDQEGVSRELVEFIGLEWHDDCLRFYEKSGVTLTASVDQVRRPMYRSAVGRHRRYDEHLGPLRRALGIDAETREDG